jgi:two-component system chemotaxis response regulator CheB
MIVDDSAVMRGLLRSVISSSSGLEVASTATDGASAIQLVQTERPDLILLDVEMPVKDGLATLRELRARGHKMPIIMCSSLTQRGAKVTIEALAIGASDYVAKPTGQTSREAAMRKLSQELIPKINALTSQLRQQSTSATASSLFFAKQAPPPPGTQIPTVAPSIVAIGVSTGGPAALDVVLPALPANFPLPIVIVQHMPEVFTKLFAERMNSRCKLHVAEASEGAPVVPGTIYIARGNWHMEVMASMRPGAPNTLHLNQDSPENHCRPAVDVLFRSVAKLYGGAVLAVILTGMGSDGLIGCRPIREQGGTVLAQDQATSTVWGMPGAVTQAGLAHRVLPLNAIALDMIRTVGRSTPTSTTGNQLRNPDRVMVS